MWTVRVADSRSVKDHKGFDTKREAIEFMENERTRLSGAGRGNAKVFRKGHLYIVVGGGK